MTGEDKELLKKAAKKDSKALEMQIFKLDEMKEIAPEMTSEQIETLKLLALLKISSRTRTISEHMLFYTIVLSIYLLGSIIFVAQMLS